MSSLISAETVQAARKRLQRYGLLKDGTYGTYEGPCCAVGHIAAACGWLYPKRWQIQQPLMLLPTRLVGRAWREWYPKPDRDDITEWNDAETTTVGDVDAFYGWWIEQLEGTP